MSHPGLDLVAARRWAVTARLMLAGARERIDALNVFPVADGDTGTNMYLTIDGSLDFVRGQFELGAGSERLDEGLALIARGMLLSARGNSGVILAQLTRGLSDAVGPEVQVAGPEELALAFETAARTAWDAVASPVEGTILSVARAAAQSARAAVDRARPPAGAGEEALDVLHVVREALAGAREALARTPEQLPELRHAGVVDAGGAGLVLVVEALEAVLEDRPHRGVADLPSWWETGGGGHHHGPGEAGAHHDPGTQGTPGGGVEVMYLLTGSDERRAERLRAHLDRLGSSVAVAGGPDVYRVHVHLDDPRLAVEAGALAGVVEDVRMTSLEDGSPLAPLPGPPPPGESRGPGRHAPGDEVDDGAAEEGPTLAVVACGLGAGVERLLAGAGTQVVPSGPRHRASAGQLLAAVRAAGAPRVALLPNDADTVMVAMAAADAAAREGVVVDVVPSRTLVQGLAALAVLDPAADPDAAVAAMAEAAAAVRPGALTRAERAAETPVGPVAPGQWIGIVDHAIVAVDDRLAPVASRVLDLLWHDGAEVVTVLRGHDARDDELAGVLEELARRRPGVEVEQVEGGQPTYPYLLGVE